MLNVSSPDVPFSVVSSLASQVALPPSGLWADDPTLYFCCARPLVSPASAGPRGPATSPMDMPVTLEEPDPGWSFD